jgi:hypothetical protein
LRETAKACPCSQRAPLLLLRPPRAFRPVCFAAAAVALSVTHLEAVTPAQAKAEAKARQQAAAQAHKDGERGRTLAVGKSGGAGTAAASGCGGSSAAGKASKPAPTVRVCGRRQKPIFIAAAGAPDGAPAVGTAGAASSSSTESGVVTMEDLVLMVHGGTGIDPGKLVLHEAVSGKGKSPAKASLLYSPADTLEAVGGAGKQRPGGGGRGAGAGGAGSGGAADLARRVAVALASKPG